MSGTVSASVRAIPAPASDGVPKRRARGRAPGRSLAALLAGTAVALWAQQAVTRGESGETTLLAFAAAAALFIAGVTTGSKDSLLDRSVQLERSAPPAIHRPLLMGAIGLGLLTFLVSGGNRFTLLNVTTWIASVVVALIACLGPTHGLRGKVAALALRALGTRPSATTIAFGVIWLVGVLLLFHRLGDVPREMTSDHAEKLLDVRDVLDGMHRIFFPRNTGREAMQFYVIAVLSQAVGLTYLALKLSTVLIAAFTPPFTFLLTRVVFGPYVALLATAILVVTRWHLQVARVGLRYPFPPLFSAAIFFFLFKALRDRRRADFLWCGLAMGIALHTYTPLRVAGVAVLVCLLIALCSDVARLAPPRRVQRLVLDSALLFLVAGLVFVPLGRFAVDEPGLFLYRGATRLVSDSLTGPPPNAALVFAANVKNAFLMFNWTGDAAWLASIPGERAVDPVSGALVALGFAYALFRLGRHREERYLWLLVCIFVGFLPSTLSLAFPHENPSVVRSGMVVPFVAMLVATPLALIARQVLATLPGLPGRAVAAALVGGALLAIARLNYEQYFEVYARQHAASSQHTSVIGQAAREFLLRGGERQDIHVVPWPHWIDTRLIAIESGDIRANPLMQNVDEARTHDGAVGPRFYIVHPDDSAALAKLTGWYPGSTQTVHALPDTAGRPWFVTVQVSGGARARV